ncbi:MAG: Hpt domain-containing protein [Bacteroidales bacterium]|nr:Hpt domain-containing protein [Bacteroidales bacterium]
MIETHINIKALKERTADDKQLAQDLLQILKKSLQTKLGELVDAIVDSNYNLIAFLLHKLKTSVATLGFDKLKAEIESVEQEAQNNSSTFDYKTKINCIFISLNNHITELNKILNT